ncbi:MAG TPA: hypothetical protein PK691_00505 [Thermomicrobiales bacterium]|nr:hypothetical protein [Thermomicrobiales bacterium]HRA47935.1 hypothetical protein [Thermomicrobiales bacterium]
MGLYLVETIPSEHEDLDNVPVQSPSDLRGLAEYSAATNHGARWLTTFSPDLNDDRHFSIWESPDADEIRSLMDRFGFLHEGTVRIVQVRQWGPSDVLEADSEPPTDW